MTKVAIMPVPTEKGGLLYRGVAGDKQSRGSTPGEALDALVTQFGDDGAGLLVVVQSLRPDRFFNAVQQQRLSELMQQWHAAQDQGGHFPPEQQAELEALIKTELLASTDRAAALADELADEPTAPTGRAARGIPRCGRVPGYEQL